MSRALLGAAFLLLPAAAVGQEARGFAEVRAGFQFGVDGPMWTLVERVRPTLEAGLGRRVKLVGTVDVGIQQGRELQAEIERIVAASDFQPLLELASCTWPARPDHPLLRAGSIDDLIVVDRLFVDFYLPGVDLRVGRQAIQWGSATFVNPTDPFPELLLGQPWRPRQGLDAIRANVVLPDDADLTAVVATNRAFDAFRGALRLRGRLGPADLAVVGAYRSDGDGGRGDGLFGVDLRGTLGVGYWVEASIHAGRHAWEEIAVGVDYSFPVLERFLVQAQYYRNGAGSKEAAAGVGAGLGGSAAIHGPDCDEEAVGAVDATAGSSAGSLLFGEAAEPEPFAPVLRGRDYLLVNASLGIVPELSVSFSALQNLGDGSGMLLPTVQASPLGWLDIGATAQIPYALQRGGGEFKPNPDDLVLETDLGLFGVRTLDLRGLLPDATLTIWTRASF